MLKLEVNKIYMNYIIDKYKNNQRSGILIGMKPIEDDCLFKVNLYKDQSLVAFPKFTTFGIGFHKEKDWNTNLSYISDEIEIYNHIKCNKFYKEIKRKDCIEAIKMLKIACEVFVSIYKNKEE